MPENEYFELPDSTSFYILPGHEKGEGKSNKRTTLCRCGFITRLGMVLWQEYMTIEQMIERNKHLPKANPMSACPASWIKL